MNKSCFCLPQICSQSLFCRDAGTECFCKSYTTAPAHSISLHLSLEKGDLTSSVTATLPWPPAQAAGPGTPPSTVAVAQPSPCKTLTYAIKASQTRPKIAHNTRLGPSTQLCHGSSRPVCITDSTARLTCALQICHHLSKNSQHWEQQAFLRLSPHPLRLHCPMCLLFQISDPTVMFHCSVLMAFCASEVQPDLLCRTDG